MITNSLDELLLSSLKDKTYYHQFINCLLKSKVYIPCGNALNMEMLPIWLDKAGRKFIPLFSTVNALRKASHLAESIQRERYVKLSAQELFLKLNNIGAVLNPNLEYTKEFSIEEVEWLKQQYNSPWFLPSLEGCKLLIFQPVKIPLQSLHKLTEIFKKNSVIKSASYSKIHVINKRLSEYELVGIRSLGDFYSAFFEIESELNSCLGELGNFRFIDMNQANKIAAQLQKYEAFYKT